MRENDKKRLKANHKYLVQNLNIEEIQDYLFEKDVLTNEELEDLLVEKTATRAARSVLLLLPKKNDAAFDHLISALQEVHAEHVVEVLYNTAVDEFKESDYDQQLHEEDKIKQLQSQMFMQTEFILQAKKEIDFLKERVRMNEEDSSNLRKRYSELETTMGEKGLQQSDVVELITGYMESTDVPDIANANFASPLPSPKNPKPRPGSGAMFSFSNEDINMAVKKNSQTACVVIAREMGRDVVKYVVQKALKKKRISPPASKYCATMRRLVDELYAKWQGLFDRFITHLKMDEISGLQTFINVAEEIFQEGENNWGRVVVLYAFAGYVARHCVENDMEKIAEFVGDFLGYYVVHKLGPWIEENGGWDAFQERFNQKEADPSGSLMQKLLWTAVGISGVVAVAGIVVARHS